MEPEPFLEHIASDEPSGIIETAEMLAAAGQAEQAATLQRDVVGRNVLDGHWTFQVVDEFDDLYDDGVRSALRSLEDRYRRSPPRARGAD